MSRTDSEEEGPDIPPFVWTGKEIKKRWMDLLNTAESLLDGNAPVIYGCTDTDFVITNWGKTIEHVVGEYKKFQKPDPKAIEEVARRSGRRCEDVQADYLKDVEQAFWMHATRIFHLQFAKKMQEARSKFIIELTDQVCKLLNGQKIQSSIDSDFHFTYTDQLKKALEKAQKRIEKTEKLRLGTRLPGALKKHKWTQQTRNEFTERFEDLKPIWKGARRLYRSKDLQRFDEKKRLELVGNAYPGLPPDLLRDLPVAYAPSEIAIEHAARLCNVPPSTYTARQLKEYLLKRPATNPGSKSKTIPS